MVEFFQGLSTKHIVLGSIVAIYLLGIFALRFWCGLLAKPDEETDDLDAIWWWPLFIPLIIFDETMGLGRWLIKKFPKTSHELHFMWKKIVLVIDYATLPVRPFTLGQRIVQWRKDKERNKPQQVPWAHRNNWIVRIKRWVKSLFNNTTSYKK